MKKRLYPLLNQISLDYQRILGGKLTGLYLHGSIAFGCFRWDASDIDFLAVVNEPLSQSEKEALIQSLLALDASAPPKGFEMSVVLRSACSPFADPTPFELHYSNAHRASYLRDLPGTCRALQGFDPDLAAHMTIIRRKGIVLFGLPVEAVFAPVPAQSTLRSIWYDVESAPQDILRDPVYCALNLCRALAFAQEGLILSKAEGGEWGLRHLPQHAAVIRPALEAYLRGVPPPDGQNLVPFAQSVLKIIRKKIDTGR